MWEENIKMYLKDMWLENVKWIILGQERVVWFAFVNRVMNVQLSQKADNFLSRQTTSSSTDEVPP